MTGNNFPTYSSFRTQFLQRYGENQAAVIDQFQACRQESGETAVDYRDRFCSLASRAGAAADAGQVTKFSGGCTLIWWRTLRSSSRSF